MNTQDLELFLHLSRTMHYGRTAAECKVTPSDLTSAILRLEAEIGDKLFLNETSTPSLSVAGKLLVEHARISISSLQQFRSQLHGGRSLSGRIRIYCSVTAIITILPRILYAFRTAYPDVVVQVKTGYPARSLPWLLDGDVDISIVALSEHIPESIDHIILEETPLLFISPRFFPEVIARKENGEIDWTCTPLILPAEGVGRIRAERWFAAKNIRPYIFADVGSNEAVTPMVSIGLGVGVVPYSVLNKNTLKDEVEIMPLTPQLEPFAISACMMNNKHSDEVVEAFWKMAAKTVANR